MDGFIGYSTQGYENLMSEISTRKSNLLEILNSFEEVYTAIENCWIGEDATQYVTELKNTINRTITSVEETYSALEKQCNTTYQDWVSKQSV